MLPQFYQKEKDILIITEIRNYKKLFYYVRTLQKISIRNKIDTICEIKFRSRRKIKLNN